MFLLFILRIIFNLNIVISRYLIASYILSRKILFSNKAFNFLKLKILNNLLNVIILLSAFNLKANILLFFFLILTY